MSPTDTTLRKSPQTAHRPRLQRAALLWALATLAAPAVLADDGQRTAIDQGCMNCHMPTARTAPALGQISEKMKRQGDETTAVQHMLSEMREHDAVHSHRMVGDDAALVALRWMAHGTPTMR